METEVYIDLYFLVNAGMDFLCLMISAAILHRQPKGWRCILGAILGGVYACMALLLGLSRGVGILLDLLAACGLCAVTFGWRRLPRAVGVQLLISALLGGIMTLLFSLLNRMELPLEQLEGDGISVWVFALLAALSGVFTLRGGKLLGGARRQRTVQVRAVLFGETVELLALVDSGNLLRDPVSGRGVIVASKEVLLPHLPRELTEEGLIPGHRLAVRMRLIPVRTASGEGVLRAILPDSLTVTEGDREEDCDYLVAIAELGDRAAGFDALFPAA